MILLLRIPLSMTNALLRRLVPRDEAPTPDPVDHPALLAMSPREFADLPFPRAPAGEGRADALGGWEPETLDPHDRCPAA